MSRNTTSGQILESLVEPVLTKNGYVFSAQPIVGQSISGGKHKLDVLITSIATPTMFIPLSLKWQEVSGSAQEKVPFEVIKLIHLIRNNPQLYPYALIVLGGEGWSSIKEFYLKNGLSTYIVDSHLVKIISLDAFITLANRKQI